MPKTPTFFDLENLVPSYCRYSASEEACAVSLE